MINKKITFLSAQPDIPYFHWQIEVFINNATKVGINPNWIDILLAYDEEPSTEGRKLASMYPFVRFFFYKKTKCDNYGYIPILRPDIIAKHLLKYPALSRDAIFYHDSDIIFNKLPDFNKLLDDNIWYLSDTVSYIGSNYIRSKSDALLSDMCDIAGISKDLVISNNMNSGGAQYLMKGADHNFWMNVNFVALDLYKYMLDRETEERKNLTPEELVNYNPIQKWCADMWAVLWCSLKLGNDILISDELSFSWGSGSAKDWDAHNIMHNAGVVDNRNGEVFYKSEYMNISPWDVDFSKIDKNSNSYNYVQAILYAKNNRRP
jgi:hypothetical protein